MKVRCSQPRNGSYLAMYLSPRTPRGQGPCCVDCRQLWKPVLTGTRQIWVQRCGFPGPLRKGRGEGVSENSGRFQAGKAGDRTRKTCWRGQGDLTTRYPSVHQRLSTTETTVQKEEEGQGTRGQSSAPNAATQRMQHAGPGCPSWR